MNVNDYKEDGCSISVNSSYKSSVKNVSCDMND